MVGSGIVEKKLKQQVKDLKRCGSRICYISLKGRFSTRVFLVYKVNIVEEKDAFFDK